MRPCTQNVDPLATAPAAVALMEYLVHRQEPSGKNAVTDTEDAVEEWLIEACAARRRFREVATPALRSTRRRAASGELGKDYERAVAYLANKQERQLLELVDEALEASEVQRVLDRSGARAGLITSVREAIGRSDIAVRVDHETLTLVTRGKKRQIVNDTVSWSESPADSLLRLVSRTWATHGPGLATVVNAPVDTEDGADEISWTNGVAQALVQGAWLFDRDVRDLQDLRSLPAVDGTDGVTIAAGILILAGLILISIADCIADDNPELAAILRVIGTILVVAGLVIGVAGGVPTQVCRIEVDPVTGLERRVCAPI